MAILLSLQNKVARNDEKIASIRELNPNINTMAFGTAADWKKSGSAGRPPECRLVVPDTAFLVKESDSSGQGLPVMKPYVPGAPLVLVPPPPVPVDKQGAAGEKDKGGAAGASKTSKGAVGGAAAATGTDAVGKPVKKVTQLNVFERTHGFAAVLYLLPCPVMLADGQGQAQGRGD